MSTADLTRIIEQADALEPDEKLELIAHVARSLLRPHPDKRVGRAWPELEGTAPNPLLGEDAQVWVTRTRREADERRGRALDRQP